MTEDNKPEGHPAEVHHTEAPKEQAAAIKKRPKPVKKHSAKPSSDDELNLDFSAVTKFFKGSKKESAKPSKDDEEVSIDFSGIKKMFKGSKKEHVKESSHEKEEEISLNFSGLKKFFKSDQKKEKPSGEEISFNFKGAFGWLKKNYLILLILIPLLLSVSFRMQSMDLVATDQWAANSVVTYYKTLIRDQVNQQYPNLPDQNKNSLVEKQFSDFAKQNKGQLDQQIGQTAAFFKSYFQYEVDGKQYNYMPDIDPYFWLRYARNYDETGHQYDELKDGKPWDNHMLAPTGADAQQTTHNFILAWTYKIVSIFDSKATIMQGASYFPVILMAFAVIPAFFVGRRISGNVGGFFTAALIAVHPAIMGRTIWGHADTDVYNIFFPLLITWLFLEAFEAKQLKNKLIISAVAGLSLAVYGFFWEWWYVFYLTLGVTAIYLLYVLVTNISEVSKGISHFIRLEHVKNTLLITAAYVASSVVFGLLFFGFSSFIHELMGPFRFIFIKAAVAPELWPNVYTTVAELNEASLNDIIGSMGGRLLFYLSILGILLTFTKKDSAGKSDIKYPLLIAVWFIATIYASLKGVRFTLLLAPMFSIALGAAFGIGYKFLTGWFERSFEVSRKITGTVLVVLMLALVGLVPLPGASGCPFFPNNGVACSGFNTARSDIPIVNDVWYNALTKIKDNSEKDAIITSWWDFGHHFKYIADRPVTFDGASQFGTHAHYVGKLLLTEDEAFSVSILRMLDCGGTELFREINKITKDATLDRYILDKIIRLDRSKARSFLINEQKFSGSDADKILDLTHCSPPEAFLITSDDMIGKAGVWGHFGSWDMTKADVWLNAKSMPRQQAIDYLLAKKHYGLTEEQAENLYDEARSIFDERQANNWISPWPGYVAGPDPCQIFENQSLLMCQNGAAINFSSNEAIVQTQQGTGHPTSVIFPRVNGDLKETKFTDSLVPLSLVIVPTKDGLTGMLTSPELAKSMFTRLFFMKGHGLSCYKLASDEKGLTGTTVMVWKVDWQCSTKNQYLLTQDYLADYVSLASE